MTLKGGTRRTLFFRRSSHVGPTLRSYRLTNSDQNRHCNPRGKERVLDGQPRPILRGGTPAHPYFGDPATNAHGFNLQRPNSVGNYLRCSVCCYLHVIWHRWRVACIRESQPRASSQGAGSQRAQFFGFNHSPPVIHNPFAAEQPNSARLHVWGGSVRLGGQPGDCLLYKASRGLSPTALSFLHVRRA